MAYQCPLCQLELHATQQGLSCDNRHQFDRAKEGYVNLMPVQHKRSKQPGDSPEMMQARRAFLDADFYHPMREKLAELILTHHQNGSCHLLDIGCGEGYYTHYIAKQLAAKNITHQVYGLDIAKVAIRYAAKRYTDVDFCVASSYRLPFANQSLDALVRIYAPCEAGEMARVLAHKGLVFTVTPAARHLFQLRELVYPDVRLHDETSEEIEGFELVEAQKLEYKMQLSGQDAFNLLQMTPFAWKADQKIQQGLAAMSEFECEAGFMIHVYQKRA